VIKDIPRGGVDIFGCTSEVRDHLLHLQGIDSNLIALLFWLGYRREYIVYQRQQRLEGESAWTLRKTSRTSLSSYCFTPGAIALVLAVSASILVIVAKLRGNIPVPGYIPIVLATMFFGALTSLGFGIVRPISLARITNQQPPPQLHHPFRRRLRGERSLTTTAFASADGGGHLARLAWFTNARWQARKGNQGGLSERLIDMRSGEFWWRSLRR
jgi:hypothetical protein